MISQDIGLPYIGVNRMMLIGSFIFTTMGLFTLFMPQEYWNLFAIRPHTLTTIEASCAQIAGVWGLIVGACLCAVHRNPTHFVIRTVAVCFFAYTVWASFVISNYGSMIKPFWQAAMLIFGLAMSAYFVRVEAPIIGAKIQAAAEGVKADLQYPARARGSAPAS